MPDPVISVRNLSKRYRLGATLRHDTLRDHIVDAVKSGWTRLVQRPTSNVQRSTLNAGERKKALNHEWARGAVIGGTEGHPHPWESG